MVFVALWFGSSTMVALIFAMEGYNPRFWGFDPREVTREKLWRYKIRLTSLAYYL